MSSFELAGFRHDVRGDNLLVSFDPATLDLPDGFELPMVEEEPRSPSHVLSRVPSCVPSCVPSRIPSKRDLREGVV